MTDATERTPSAGAMRAAERVVRAMDVTMARVSGIVGDPDKRPELVRRFAVAIDADTGAARLADALRNLLGGIHADTIDGLRYFSLSPEEGDDLLDEARAALAEYEENA